MSSILTNTSAMTALQTLRGVNTDLARTQDMISTGKKVANAKDNSAIFAISKTMESDVAGFKALSESLSLGNSTIAVASNATSQIGGLLEEIKGKITSASSENVDRASLQNEIDQLRDQITGIVGAAQFNGKNLLQDDDSFSILASLDRSPTGAVTSNSITVSGRDFGTDAGVAGTGASGKNASISGSGVTASESGTNSLVLANNANIVDGTDVFRVTIDGVQIDASLENMQEAGTIAATATQASDEDVAAYIAGVINGTNDAGPSLNMQGVSATITDTAGAAGISVSSTASEEITLSSANVGAVAAGTALSGTLAAVTGEINTRTSVSIDMTTNEADAADETVSLTLGENTFTYTSSGDLNAAATLTEMVGQFNQQAQDQGLTQFVFDEAGTSLTIGNLSTEEAYDVAIDTSGLTTNAAGVLSNPSLDAATAVSTNIDISGTIVEGDSFSVDIGGQQATYVAGANENANDVIRGLQAVIAADGPAGINTSLTFANNPGQGDVASISLSGDVGGAVTLTEARGGTEATGALYGLSTIDVTTSDGATKALDTIESLIQVNIDAQAEFGASARRVDLQNEFMTSLIDSFKTGIGALVDTDMEAASARLQALQVQQQLAVQSLSIANQAPQTILSLFR